MKYILSLLLVGMSAHAFAQDSEPINFLKLQGGLVYDSRTSKDYAGFDYLNIGWSRLKNERIDGIELELMAFDQVIEREIISVPGTASYFEDWKCERTAIELSYFRTFSLVNDINNGVFVGPFASASFMATRLNPTEGVSGSTMDSRCYCFGIGAKIDYYAKLTEKMHVTLGVKLNIIGAGLYENINNNPALTERQQKSSSFDAGILEGKIPLALGVIIKI